MTPEFQAILRDLRELQTTGGSQDFFGASEHKYELNPTVREATILEFEAKHFIELPIEYRCFLTEVGNGGAGPYYGLFKLGEIDSDWDHCLWDECPGFVGDLSAPFPHTEHWNDLTGEPCYGSLADEIYEQQLTLFENHYFASANINGAIPICHIGCNLRHLLIVTGPERGYVWLDERADRKGLSPLAGSDGERVTFYRWYRDWLDEALSWNK